MRSALVTSIFIYEDFFQCYSGFAYSCNQSMGAHLKDKNAVFQTYRTSVSFMCNYSNKGNPCNPDEWAAAVGWLLVSCS